MFSIIYHTHDETCLLRLLACGYEMSHNLDEAVELQFC